MNEILKSNNEIRAVFDSQTIRVYQAYNDQIADELIALNTFGLSFNLNRMSWIKPSFLWMMFRSGWGTKENQTRIFAFDISISIFKEILDKAVLSSYHDCYGTVENWKSRLERTEVLCQWDPEKDINGKSLNYRTIQIGLRGETLKRYAQKGIIKITEITEMVIRTKQFIDNKELNKIILPVEGVYNMD